MKRLSIILAIALLICMIGWAYTCYKYKPSAWWDIKDKLYHLESMLYLQQGSDLPYEGKTDKEVLDMLPPPDQDYMVKYYKNDSIDYFYDEVWAELLVDGVDTILIKGFDWEFDHRITNLSKLHIDFIQKNGKWMVNYACRWDPVAVRF